MGQLFLDNGGNGFASLQTQWINLKKSKAGITLSASVSTQGST